MLLEITKIYSSNDLLPQMAHAVDYELPKVNNKLFNQAIATYAKHLNCNTSEIAFLDPKINENQKFVVDVFFSFNVTLINALKRTGSVWYNPENKSWRFTPKGVADKSLGESVASCMKYAIYFDNSGSKLYENMNI